MDETTTTQVSRLPPSRMGQWAVLMAGASLLVGLPWIRWAQERPLERALIGETPLHDSLIGLTTGTLLALLAWTAFLYIPPLRRALCRLHEVVTLEALTPGWILVTAFSAGVGEEVLFRGVLQPHLGLWLTSLLFGLAHPLSYTYVAYATLAGLVLGWLTWFTGNLVAAMVAHTVVDAIMLAMAARWARQRMHTSA